MKTHGLVDFCGSAFFMRQRNLRFRVWRFGGLEETKIEITTYIVSLKLLLVFYEQFLDNKFITHSYQSIKNTKFLNKKTGYFIFNHFFTGCIK